MSDELKLATGLIRTFDGLYLFSDQVDREGKYEEYVESIVGSYAAQNDNAANATDQSVNALYQSVKLVALLVEEHSTSQDMIDQIEAGLTQFGEDMDGCETAGEHLSNGAYWLCKMFGALGKLRDPDGSFYAQIEDLMADTQENSDFQDGVLQKTVVWLKGCVRMTGLLADEAEAAMAAA